LLLLEFSDERVVSPKLRSNRFKRFSKKILGEHHNVRFFYFPENFGEVGKPSGLVIR
jgi:hypothetical protein